MKRSSVTRLGVVVAALALVASFAVAGIAQSATSTGCTWPALRTPFTAWGDSGLYFLAPGGSFETGASGWTLAGSTSVVQGNESYHVGSSTDSRSLSLPDTASSATTPTICVTSDSPVFRMFVKNNGNLGKIDGQLAVYLNYTGADGRRQQVKIAGLTVTSTAWTLSPKISFIQYISTPLQAGYASVSFTIKPNDTHGN